MTGARFIAETFRQYGLTHVFFVESILRLTLLEMEQYGIRRVLAHSEGAAAHMADGYARVTRRPGLCLAQSVGAANLAAGLQDAYLGRSPVIAITGRKPTTAQGRNAYQEILHNPLFLPVTKYRARIDSALQLPLVLCQAFREATTGTPRPVHLDTAGLMGEVIERAEGDFQVVVESNHRQFPAYRSIPQEDHLREAASLLAQAQRPVIVAGWGALLSSAGSAIHELAQALAIPVAYSLDGKGIIPENSPAAVGVVGSYSDKSANRVVSEADLVMFAGNDTGDQATNGWRIPRPGTAIIQIDADPSEIGISYPGTLGIAGDPKLSLQALLRSINREARKDTWFSRVRQIVADWREELRPLENSDGVPIRVERLCRELSERLPTDVVFVADTGYSGIWTGTMVHLTQPSQTYLRAAGTLGWAFPAALGAKCGAPERPVICFTGDGGFYYHLSELETAMRHGIKTVTVVNNNSGFGQCLEPVERLYANRAGNPHDLTCFRPMNFARIAEDMGAHGIRVEHPAEIGPAIETALRAEAPTIIDVVTDPRSRAPAPWTPEA